VVWNSLVHPSGRLPVMTCVSSDSQNAGVLLVSASTPSASGCTVTGTLVTTVWPWASVTTASSTTERAGASRVRVSPVPRVAVVPW
jgi:hypothetical protein